MVYSLLFFRSSLSFQYRRRVPSEGKPATRVSTSHLKLVKRENIIRLQDKQYLLAGNNNICGHKINLPSNINHAKVDCELCKEDQEENNTKEIVDKENKTERESRGGEVISRG